MKTVLLFLVLLASSVLSDKVSLPELDGAVLLNRGLDFHQGGLIPEERVRSPIFEYSYNQGKTYTIPGRPNLKWKVPDQTVVTSARTHLEKYDSKIHMSYAETLRMSVWGFNFGIGINTGVFGVGAEFGMEYGRIKHNLRQEYKATANGLYYTTVYSVIGLPYLFMPMDQMFTMVMDRIPATPRNQQDLELYRIAIQYYGGFFMWQGMFGGQIKTYSYFNQKIVEERSQSWMSLQMKLTFHYKLFELSGGGFYNRSSIDIHKDFIQNSNSEIYFTGGYRHLQTNKTLDAWDKSIDNAPGFLTGQFRPISDLISNQPVKKQNLEWVIKHYSETGKMSFPPASMLIRSVPKVPGYSIIGAGFDPSHLQTRMSVFDHDEFGFDNAQIWTNPFYRDLQFAVPSSVYLRENTGSLETNMTDISMTQSQFETTFAQKWTKRGFFTRRTTEVYNFIRRNDLLAQHKITTEKQVNWYDLSLNPMVYFNRELRNKHLNPQLKYVIDNLPTNTNDVNAMALYKLIIEYWGTHFVMGTKMGGRLEQEVFFDKELLEYHSINEIRTQSSFSFFGIINTNKYDYRKDEKIGKWFKDHADIKTRFVGGRYMPEVGQNSNSRDKPWDEFLKSVRSDPGVLEYDVVPISNLIDDPQKKAIFEKQVELYVEEMKNIPAPKDAPKKFVDAETENNYWINFIENLAK